MVVWTSKACKKLINCFNRILNLSIIHDRIIIILMAWRPLIMLLTMIILNRLRVPRISTMSWPKPWVNKEISGVTQLEEVGVEAVEA